MRFNQDSLRFLAQQPGQKEGNLLYKAPKEGYHSRWVKLRSNLLFIFKLTDQAISDPEPMSVLVLEGMKVRMELPQDMPFVFSLCFDGEGGKKHLFSGQTEKQCQEWITAIQEISHAKLKAQFEFLKSQLKLKTGKDPLDIYFSKIKHDRHSTSRLNGPAVGQNVISKKELVMDRHTVGASAFYPYEPPAVELQTYFKNWETFD